MNLIIEYITRKKDLIKNLFETPSSLFLENKNSNERIAVVFQEKEEGIVSVRHWYLFQKLSNNTIKKKIFILKKQDIFESDVVLVNGLKPIEYTEEPVNTRRNHYNHPIDYIDYNSTHLNFLNSNLHKSFKKDWLWDTFIKTYFGVTNSDRLGLSLQERRIQIEKEKKFIKNKHYSYWKKWNIWKYKLIYQEKVSNELIFKHDLKKIIQIN